MIEDYFRQVAALISNVKIIHSSRITYDKRSSYIGFLRGDIYFFDGSLLHIREFVNIENGVERYIYAYHYQDSNGALIFRYDNTPHFPTLSTFPHHKHETSEANVVPASQPDLQAALTEIQNLLTLPEA